jgi:hypothetical protein
MGEARTSDVGATKAASNTRPEIMHGNRSSKIFDFY